jgi:hypothetical protein
MMFSPLLCRVLLDTTQRLPGCGTAVTTGPNRLQAPQGLQRPTAAATQALLRPGGVWVCRLGGWQNPFVCGGCLARKVNSCCGHQERDRIGDPVAPGDGGARLGRWQYRASDRPAGAGR